MFLQKRAVEVMFGINNKSCLFLFFVKFRILTVPSWFKMDCLLFIKRNISDFPIHAQGILQGSILKLVNETTA